MVTVSLMKQGSAFGLLLVKAFMLACLLWMPAMPMEAAPCHEVVTTESDCQACKMALAVWDQDRVEPSSQTALVIHSPRLNVAVDFVTPILERLAIQASPTPEPPPELGMAPALVWFVDSVRLRI